jgi:hypothetical protein
MALVAKEYIQNFKNAKNKKASVSPSIVNIIKIRDVE